MCKHIGWGSVARKLQHGGPKQGVKVQDIFANKVVLLNIRVRRNKPVKVASGVAAEFLKTCVIADWGVKPDIKVFAWCIRDFEAKIGRITGDIPVAETSLLSKPFLEFIARLRLKARIVDSPLTKEVGAAGIRESEKIMIRFFPNRGCTRDH